MTRATTYYLLAALVATTACSDSTPPLLEPEGVAGGGPSFAAAVTPVRGRVVWLDPLDKPAVPLGALAADLSPTVEVCEWRNDACVGSPIAVFTMTTGPAGTSIVATSDSYQANWSLGSSTMRFRKTYRLRVLVDGVDEGSILVDAIRGRWAPSSASGPAPMRAASTLPIRFWIGNGRYIDESGGTVEAMGAGASLELGGGLLSEPTLVQLDELPDLLSAIYPTSEIALRWVMQSLPVTATGEVRLFVTHSPLPEGYRTWAQAEFKGAGLALEDPLWLRMETVDATHSVVELSAADILEVQDVLSLSRFDLTLRLGRARSTSATSSPSSESSSSSVSDGSLSAFRVISVSAREVTESLAPTSLCSPPVNPGDVYAPCDTRVLRLAANQASARSGSIAVVLVHGWVPKVADANGYQREQGCPSRNSTETVIKECGGVFAILPGEVYWTDWLSELPSELADQPVYVYSYESFYRYEASGAALARLLDARLAQQGYSGYILVGHSMGGLVARVAAQTSPSVRGVVALGAMHRGTALPSLWRSRLTTSVWTPGGQSMLDGLPRTETQPLFAYGGSSSAGKASYFLGNRALGPDLRPNDGVVPLCSALPRPGQLCRGMALGGFDLGVTFSEHPRNHSQLIEGIGPIASDNVFRSVVGDIRSLLAVSPPNGPGTPEGSYWAFNGNLLDSEGASSLTAIGPIGFASGVSGASADFGGSSVAIGPANDAADAQDVGTVALWVRPVTAEQGVLLAYSTDATNNSVYAFQLEKNGVVMATYKFGNKGFTPQIFTGPIVPLNAWSHLAFVADGMSRIKIYMNGEEQPTTFTDQGSGGTGREWFAGFTDARTFEHRFTLGALRRQESPAGQVWFRGRIDEARVYTTALSAAAVRDLYLAHRP